MVKAIVGANWGDEGKGKITDALAEQSDVVVRFQGGANAGHTIINDYGRFALHMMPSGIFCENVTCIVANGVALEIPQFISEYEEVKTALKRDPKVLVSDRAHIVMPYHKNFDAYEEERRAGGAFGSTKSGIAPVYSDKYSKIGFQACELFDKDALAEKLKTILPIKNTLLKHLYNKPEINLEETLNTLLDYGKQIKPFLCDTSKFLRDAIKNNKTILLEGQLGTMKDIEHGIYPMVTSSSTLAGYGATGAGIPPYEIKQIIAVSKAYSSAVGAGDFVSEIFGDEAEELRKRGGDKGEYGAKTGRPRRVGWYDTVASKFGVKLQGATDVALTVLDPLGYLDEIKVCVGYEIDGKVTTEFPTTPDLHRAKPVYETLKGWKCDIRGIKKYEELPKETRDYIEFIEKHIETPITMVSNGPERSALIHRK